MITLRIAVLAVVLVCCAAAIVAAWRVRRLRWMRAYQALSLAWLAVIYAWAVLDPDNSLVRSGILSQTGILCLGLGVLANIVLDWDGHA